MTKKFLVILIISMLALCLSVFSFMISLKTGDKVKENEESESAVTEEVSEESEDIQYVLYLGTNDKDTNEPVYDEEESKEKLKEILLDHFGGYTIQEANGGWKDGDTVYNEYTLVIYLSDTNIDEVHKACDEMIEVFHQSSVLIQSNKTTTEFYSAE